MTGEAVAIIPARGESRGLVGKNLARVGGLSLVARAVRAARHSRGIDRVVVSTDNEKIADEASRWGAEIVQRPAAIAGDTASSESAVLHALDALDARGVRTDVVVLVQATSPFLPSGPLGDAVGRVRAGDADCVFAARASHEFFWTRSESGVEPVAHDRSHRPRRQDRDPLYVETGAFYVCAAEGFRAAGHRFFGRVDVQEVPAASAIEIDAADDLAAARALFPLQRDPIDSPAADIAAVVTDFDGVHTDDTAGLSEDGTEYVRVSRSDGMGIRLLRESGVTVLILSTERNPVVAVRARKLGVEVIHAAEDKRAALTSWAASTGVDLSRVAYVGNDVNDVGALDIVGWPVVVAGSHPQAAARARYVLSRAGGHGAVRELADLVLAARTDSPPTSEGTHS